MSKIVYFDFKKASAKKRKINRIKKRKKEETLKSIDEIIRLAISIAESLGD